MPDMSDIIKQPDRDPHYELPHPLTTCHDKIALFVADPTLAASEKRQTQTGLAWGFSMSTKKEFVVENICVPSSLYPRC